MSSERFVRDLFTRAGVDDLHVGWREVAGAVVLVEMNGAEVFVLDGIEAHIWKLLSQGCQPADIRTNLLETYDAPVEQIDVDLFEFLDDLAKRKLIHVG